MSITYQVCQQQMKRFGVRRLLVLSGDAQWGWQQAITVMLQCKGDWLWCGEESPEGFRHTAPAKIRTYLGQTFTHAVFDATTHFDVEALAVLAGSLSAGSWLVLIAPEWLTWATQCDQDSVRWSDKDHPIATPHFIHYLQDQLKKNSDAIVLRQSQREALTLLPEREAWQPANGTATVEQQQLLDQLLAAQSGIWILMAERGRGKSALAGMLAQHWHRSNEKRGLCWLTAPNQAATATLQRYATGGLNFFSPDQLLAKCQQQKPENVDWLLIDEAAAIPTALLYQLVSYFPRVLLTTTLHGYEGTGQGFLLKFCAGLPKWHLLRLSQPIRWAQQDPVECWLNSVLMFGEPQENRPFKNKWHILAYNQHALLQNIDRLRQFYLLLTSAHYRTRPLDLRRLMDAEGMQFVLAENDEQVIAGLWAVNEGNLDSALAHEIWAGRRRPRGNLVAQSLAAHSAQWQAATLQSIRISRIAVLPQYRRKSIARALIENLRELAITRGDDYLSVSFGYTAELWAFWQTCGFQWVRIGSQKETSSGCYAVMAIYPLSRQADDIVFSAQRQMKRDAYWLAHPLFSSLQIEPQEHLLSCELLVEDWRELAGFAFAHRSIEASRAALCRLLLHCRSPLLALRYHLQERQSEEQCVEFFSVKGKKALLKCWRQEAAEGMRELGYCCSPNHATP